MAALYAFVMGLVSSVTVFEVAPLKLWRPNGISVKCFHGPTLISTFAVHFRKTVC